MSALPSYLLATLTGLVAGLTAPAYNGSGGASTAASDLFVGGQHNPAGWWGLTDTTCLPLTSNNNGVLVTPRDVLFAAHYGASPTVTFVGSDGQDYTRAVAATTAVVGTDVLVATLDADLPAAVTPATVMPYPVAGNTYPLVFTNQDRRLLIGVLDGYTDAGELVFQQSATPALAPWFYAPRAYDSGSPALLLIQGKLTALLQVHSVNTGQGVGVGPGDAALASRINGAMAANGSPHALSAVDLSFLAADPPPAVTIDQLAAYTIDQLAGVPMGSLPYQPEFLPPQVIWTNAADAPPGYAATVWVPVAFVAPGGAQ